MQNIRVIYDDGSFALMAPRFTQNIILVQDVPQLIAKPTGARAAFFAKTADFYASYVHSDDGVTPADLSELAINGSFAADTDWTKGTGWTIAAGIASKAAGVASDIEQTPSRVVEGQAYYVTYTVASRTAGTITPEIGATSGVARSTNATFSEYIIAGADGTIKFAADSTFDGSIDNVSMIPAAQTPTVNNLIGSGPELNPTVRDLSLVTDMSLVTPDASGAIVTINYYA